jgi:CRISPR/Cas system-associated exonuclease Cas4 (RecB family)
MLLPNDFQFSQSSLQDYVDCPRRFQLRYILQQPWPAVESEPLLEHERYIELGRRFHQLTEQHVAGLPLETLTATVTEPELARWWQNYLHTPPQDVFSLPMRRAEVLLSAPAAGYRLVARYDLLAIEPGEQATIVDWKTERIKPLRKHLAARMQTRVYRYVLVEAGQSLNDNAAIRPEQAQMVYWFAEFPAEPELFTYNADQHADDAAYLAGLINEIAHKSDEVLALTNNTKYCQFCVYRSLCERGAAAGDSPTGEDDVEREAVEFDWAEIDEIAY